MRELRESRTLAEVPGTLYRRLPVLMALLPALLGLALAAGVRAQAVGIGDAVPAVVRIRGCDITGCNRGLGSGVLIDPSGVILTANHVTLSDPNNLLSRRLDDFVIEVTDNARDAPQARYRARLAARDEGADLAILQVYLDETTGRPVAAGELALPALPLADVSAVNLGQRLHILGYPLAGGAAINYTGTELGGFDEGGAILKVQASLSEGNSGGPALVEQEGGYAAAGVVVSRTGTQGEIGRIRSVEQLPGLVWDPAATRAWVDNVQVTVEGSGADAALAVRADLHFLDFTGRRGRLLAYVFDAATRRPWLDAASSLPRTVEGQLVLAAGFSTEPFVATAPRARLVAPAADLGVAPEGLAVRLLLWDADDNRALWRDTVWRVPVAGAGEATPVIQPTDTPQPPTATPTSTATPAPPTWTPTATATHTPPPPTFTPTATSTPAEPAAGAIWVNPVDGAEFVYVPAGPFTMGNGDAEIDDALALCQQYRADCDRAWYENAAPQHTVDLAGYWIGRTEVTNAQYRRFIEAGGYDDASYWTEDGWQLRQDWGLTQPLCWDDANVNQPDQPVVCVTWYEAVAYSRWLAAEAGREIRLPTEAEWEKAARGTDGRVFPWGDEWDGGRLNYCDVNCSVDDWKDETVDDGYARTAPVGSYPAGASPYGALDMAGNAWEWTSTAWGGCDWPGPGTFRYPYVADDGREELEDSDCRVVRGGSWYSSPDWLRAGFRGWFIPLSWDVGRGLRVVGAGSPGF